MNLKKIVLSCGIIAGLSLINIPQAKANNWQLLAGALTGARAGILLPTLAVNPIRYAFNILCTSLGSALAADILSIASGSSFEQYANNRKGNDFNAGFSGAFSIAVIAGIIAALTNGLDHISYDPLFKIDIRY